MKTIGMGLVGPGFIAAHHIDAVRRLGNVDVVAVAGSSESSARLKAAEYKVDRSYGDYMELLRDPEIQVVHNTTPNHLHFPVTMAALEAGKHVISDKPLALDPEQGRLLRDAAVASRKAHVVTFNYRGNPLVQQARSMVTKGVAGEIAFLHGQYLQDWLTDPNVYSWRSDPAKGGSSSALGDIGSHWCDLAEHVSGLRIESVLADLTTVVKTRYVGSESAEAFSRKAGGHRNAVAMGSEDLATVLLRFSNGTKGTFTVGQTLPGHKNDLQLEVNGSLCSMRWRQEVQNELWIGHTGRANEVLAKDPAFVDDSVARYVHLPGGHQESWSDAFFNLIRDAYDWIGAGASPEAKPQALPTFEDGYRSTCLVAAMLLSHQRGNIWQGIEQLSVSANR